MTFIIGLDPAQLRDWSAIAVVEMKYTPAVDTKPAHFRYELTAMNRKQGLPYDRIVEWAINVINKPEFNQGQPPVFLLDATGVGVAVKDMLRAKGVRPKAITVTTGEATTRVGPEFHIGKARLIGKFLGAFDAGKVMHNPDMPIWPQVEREMLSFRAEMSTQGHVKMEAEKGENDDMLFALAMCVWYGEEILRGGKRL